MKRLAPNSIVDTTQIGLAMINATMNGYQNVIVEPKDILTLSSK